VPPEVIYEAPGFGGGVNLRDAPTQLAADEATAILEVLLDERGGATKRLGSTSLINLGATPLMLSGYVFYRAGVTPEIIAHFDDGTIRTTSNLSSWTTRATSKSTTAPFAYETFNGKVYMTNGVDDYCSWNGTTFTVYSTLPKGKTLRLWRDTMWVSGVTAQPDRVYVSDPGNAEVFGALAFVDVAKGDGDGVTCLDTDGQVLIVFKGKRTFQIVDPVSLANRLIDPAKGCEGHFAVAHFDGTIYFLARQGICIYLGDQPSVVVSDRVGPVFAPDVLDFGKLNLAWGFSTQEFLGFILFNVVGTTFQVVHYPRYEKKPFTFLKVPARTWLTLRGASTEQHFIGHMSSGKLLETLVINIGTDDGVVIQSYIELGWTALGKPNIKKYLRRIRTVGRGTPYMEIKTDFEAGDGRTFLLDMALPAGDTWNPAETWGVGTWGGLVQSTEDADIHPDLYGRFFSLRLIDADTGTNVKLLDVAGSQVFRSVGQWACFSIVAHAILMGDRL
jgi:hypothetical protein